MKWGGRGGGRLSSPARPKMKKPTRRWYDWKSLLLPPTPQSEPMAMDAAVLASGRSLPVKNQPKPMARRTRPPHSNRRPEKRAILFSTHQHVPRLGNRSYVSPVHGTGLTALPHLYLGRAGATHRRNKSQLRDPIDRVEVYANRARRPRLKAKAPAWSSANHQTVPRKYGICWRVSAETRPQQLATQSPTLNRQRATAVLTECPICRPPGEHPT